MKNLRSWTLIISLSIVNSSCFAWGALGHQIVGEIAKAYVSKQTQEAVQKYFGDVKWSEAGVWMDEVRSNKFYDYMRPMHYVNVEAGLTYIPTDEPNIINELTKVIEELKDRKDYSKSITNENLKILFHLMGDLHQPLHVGYGIDRGGNSINVDFLGEPTNLHKVWDTEEIEQQKKFKAELIEMSKHITNEERIKQQKVDIMAWMNDSRSYLPLVYDYNKGKLDEAYVEKTIPIMERQILYAGIRLAAVLDDIFAEPTGGIK